MIKLKKIKSAVLSCMLAAASVTGSFTAVNSSLSVCAANDDYAKLLQYSLYFYDTNMCGDSAGDKSAITWRDDCHTSDEVTGGFHDAGDHAVFGLPQGYTASALGWSYYEFKDAYNATGQADHLKMITDHFCDFFKKSTKLNGDTVSNFLYQKGDGKDDHDYWGAPEQQSGNRKMFWTSSGASDIAADYAAALAINYINFGNPEDLKYAEALYKFSTQYNQIATDGPSGFYDSSDFKDEQANAAGWLYLATKNESYKNDCASKQVEYIGWADGWDNRGLGAACVYAYITGEWGNVNNYLGKLCSSNDYLCMDDWGSARLNCSVQFTALVASKNSGIDYSSWAKGQMDYVLGNNPFNVCFVTGYAPNSAKNAHHRAASGYQGYGDSEYVTYSPNGHVLVGALVGGPNKSGQYSDVMNDYTCNEVALDYNAGLVGAAAGLYSIYKTGSTVSSIDGVSKIYSSSSSSVPTTPDAPITTAAPSTNQPTATTPVNPGTSKDDIVLSPTDMKVDTEEGDDGEINNFAEFAPRGAKSATLYYTVNSNDTNTSGAFGTWNGKWVQEDFNDIPVPADKLVSVDYTIPSDVGSTVKAMVFWPHGDAVTIEKVVLHFGDSSGSPSVTTNAPNSNTNPTTTTNAAPGSSGNGVYEIKPSLDFDYNNTDEDQRMIGWKWADFGLTASDVPVKVEVDISANGSIGKWQGAFGTSTTVSPDYWTMSDEMEKSINGNSGTITWEIDSATQKIIQTQYNGEVKFGTWWVDCGKFTVDAVRVYVAGGSSSSTTTKDPNTQQTTTTPSQSGNSNLRGDANCDGIISIADSAAILQYLGNRDLYPLSAQGEINADIDGTVGVTANDALVIQEYDAGKSSF